MKKTKRKACRGQLSIFLALIFQVLFVFFAMSLNVALVVHDKINLQNSVDLAAYYGAMKQAETLNAIAHINYQIRQSWKLMVWRYRVLGSMSGIGNFTGVPSARPVPLDRILFPRSFENNSPGVFFTCLAHDKWGKFYSADASFQSRSDNLCVKMSTNIPALIIPSLGGSLGGLSAVLNSIVDTTRVANETLTGKCKIYGYNSWLMGFWSFLNFRKDQSARKYMIYKLAQHFAQGKDLDNQAISIGAKKTFQKNLSYVNKTSFSDPESSYEDFSSMDGQAPEKWLADQAFYTIPLYSHFKAGVGGGCEKSVDYIHQPPSSVSGITPSLLETVTYFDTSNSLCSNPDNCNMSAGLKKIDSFVVFFAVKAELSYKNQIFLPFSKDLKLKATAFAKPFGGRIGPSNDADPLLPRQRDQLGGEISLLEYDSTWAPNYSRYPGDQLGLRSSAVQYYWNEYLKKADKNLKNIKNYIVHPNDPDPLAKGEDGNTNIVARKWEVAAVTPDIFDITYFTISPSYMSTYFPRIKNILGETATFIRADLGFSIPQNYGQAIRGQVKDTGVWAEFSGPFASVSPVRLQRPFYYVKELQQLMSGWNPPKRKYNAYNDYSIVRNTDFGRCYKWDREDMSSSAGERGKVPLGCVYGGRNGYSVKLVSHLFLQQLSSAGGSSLINEMPDWSILENE